MHGSILTRIARLGAYLAGHPREFGRYLRQSLGGGSPLALRLPWFSFAAIAALERYVQPGMVVCEYGTGGSTLFFAERAARIVSVENDESWADRVAQAAAAIGLGNLDIRKVAVDLTDAGAFGRSSYLWALPVEGADIVVIDGAEDWPKHAVRPICFAHAEDRIKPGGLIVVDDSWRYPEIVRVTRAKHWRRYRSIGPARPGVTTTDFHHY